MGVFTLSLDCEGLWGMADSASTLSSGVINQRALANAYEFLCTTLDRNGIRATAAFVSAFAVPRDTLLSCRHEIRELQQLHPPWFSAISKRLDAGTDAALDGFEGHRFWRMLADAGHEMGWHGATHMPLVDTMPPDAIAREIALARTLQASLGPKPTSIVFPRNAIGSLAALKGEGFITYREKRSGGRLSRAAGFAREWNPWSRADACRRTLVNGWYVAPPGHFLNWPTGMRAFVPLSVTHQRWMAILRSAAECDRQAHMWFHPHNLITAPRMRSIFARLMGEVAALVKGGHLENLTMGEAAVKLGNAH